MYIVNSLSLIIFMKIVYYIYFDIISFYLQYRLKIKICQYTLADFIKGQKFILPLINLTLSIYNISLLLSKHFYIIPNFSKACFAPIPFFIASKTSFSPVAFSYDS